MNLRIAMSSVQLLRIAALREPVRLPAVERAEPESVRVNFLSHDYSSESTTRTLAVRF